MVLIQVFKFIKRKVNESYNTVGLYLQIRVYNSLVILAGKPEGLAAAAVDLMDPEMPLDELRDLQEFHGRSSSMQVHPVRVYSQGAGGLLRGNDLVDIIKHSMYFIYHN